MSRTVGLITAEEKLRLHVETWIDAFLGLVEGDEGIERGFVPRPAMWSRRNQWPIDDIVTTPMIVLVSAGERASRIKGRITIKTFEMRFAAVVKGDGESEKDVGDAARVYAQALAQLLTVKPTFGIDGCRVASAGDVGFADGPADNSKHIGVGRVTALVEIPYLDADPDIAAGWQPTPSPGRYDEPTPPPVPPVQATAESVSITVEPAPEPVEST